MWRGSPKKTKTFSFFSIWIPPLCKVTVPQAQDLTITLSSDDADRQATGKALKIDNVTLRCGRWHALLEAELGAVSGSATIEDDAQASAQKVVWLRGMDDTLTFAAQVLPCPEFTTEDYAYGWDQLNRLKSVSRQAGGLISSASFECPSFGWQMLTSEVTDGETGAIDSRIYGYGMGGELLKEWIATPSVDVTSRVYVNGGVDQPLWSTDVAGSNVASSFWLRDLNGSVFGMSDAAGLVQERQSFDAFGNKRITDPQHQNERSKSAIGNRLGFQGRTNFGELGLQYFRNRFYSPDLGRFISSDPLGMVDGPNTYGFCGGDPVNRWVIDNRDGGRPVQAAGRDRDRAGAVREIAAAGPDQGALLLARNGKRLGAATFRMWLRAANLARGPGQKRVHPHLLRHSIAVHLLRGGADIRHVQAFLGHSNLETTKVYLRLVPGRLKEDYDKAMPEIDVEG